MANDYAWLVYEDDGEEEYGETGPYLLGIFDSKENALKCIKNRYTKEPMASAPQDYCYFVECRKINTLDTPADDRFQRFYYVTDFYETKGEHK